MAEGVLPVCVGSCTKLSDYIAGSKKEYVAELVIGFSTDTLDVTGNVDEKDVNLLGEGVDSSVKATELVNSKRLKMSYLNLQVTLSRFHLCIQQYVRTESISTSLQERGRS